MIGVSLPVDWLITGEGGFGLEREHTLSSLRRRGVDSIELRTVLARHSAEDILGVANMLWDMGFSITVHSRMHSEATAVEDVFAPLALALASLRQRSLTLVLHPIVADNVAIFGALADHIVRNGYPVTVAIENNRLLPDGSEGDSVADTLAMVKAANRPEIAICFDMGHYMYYRKRHFPNEALVLPPEEFLKRTVHTHIHALSGLKTHFPLTDGYELPLRELVEALAWGYFGVYNFEPDLVRWQEGADHLSDILASLDALRSSLPMLAEVYDRMRVEFDSRFERATQVLKAKEGTSLSLANSTFYLFGTDGFAWAMDPAFRYARHLATSHKRVTELLSDVRLMIVTHGHVDHFEDETVAELAKTDMTWVIPDFLADEALRLGIRPEKMVIARPGEPICVDKLKILPFVGRHLRPITKKGVPAYGYHISAEGQPSLVFPTDVRDYSTEDLPDLPEADLCFAHIWLGDGRANDPEHKEMCEALSRFMLRFSDKRLVLAHLYESGRREEDMWRLDHAREVADAVRRISPSTKVIVPEPGEHIVL